MKKLLSTLLIVMTISHISSCNDDISYYKDEEITLVEKTKNPSIINGRLFFKSEEDFKSYYSNLDSKNIEEISKELDSKLYSKNFNSLVPYITEYTDPSILEKISSQSSSLNSKSSMKVQMDEDILDHFDDLEDVIGDDLFASFLNSNSEVQIANEIYNVYRSRFIYC
ncbi:hypothetical protein [Empedobacter tilapiae]